MCQDLIKALLMNAAATNAAAVCENTAGGGVPIDPLIQDTNLQGKGVMVYEEAKIQYAALLRAFQDKTGVWPDPKVSDASVSIRPRLADLAAEAGPYLTKLLPLLGAIPGAAPVVGPLASLLGLAQPKLAAPGQELQAPAAKS